MIQALYHTTKSVSNKARACPDGWAHAERLRAVTILTVESARELGCGASAEPPIEAVRDAGDRPGTTVCLSEGPGVQCRRAAARPRTPLPIKSESPFLIMARSRQRLLADCLGS